MLSGEGVFSLFDAAGEVVAQRFQLELFRDLFDGGVAGAGVALDEAPGFRETLQPRPPHVPHGQRLGGIRCGLAVSQPHRARRMFLAQP